MASALATILFLFFSMPGVSWAYEYRFDDIWGSSGVGAQWVVTTLQGNTRGAPGGLGHPNVAAEDLRTIGNIVNSRDHIYIVNGNAEGLNPATRPQEAIEHIFMAIPGSTVSTIVEFDWLNPTSGDSYTQDVEFGEAFVSKKTHLSLSSDPKKRFQFDLTKRTNVNKAETTRTYIEFHQDPDRTPSQRLNIPFIIANVVNGTAMDKPVLFRSVIRETNSASRMGNIVAYDYFDWDLAADKTVQENTDWVFVPLPNENIDSNTVNYDLITDVTNYSGIRYALDRYDQVGSNKRILYPRRWAMDLPAEVKDIDPELNLDELSHMPPGLITTYEQKFNVVKGSEVALSMYPISAREAGDPHDLTLVHSPVFGLDLGSEVSNYYRVEGFRLLVSDTDFLKKAASALGTKTAAMPTRQHNVMTGAITPGFVTADAVSTVTVQTQIPGSMMRSEDVMGLLPLHITFNLPHSNRYITPQWDNFLNTWKSTGKVNSLFSSYFSLFAHDANGNTIDLFQWMRDRDAFSDLVKVFMDEENDCVTVSFIVMVADDDSLSATLLRDQTDNVDNTYMVLRDGRKNDFWDVALFLAPTKYDPGDDNNNSGGGSGGGCNAGIPAIAGLLLGCAAFVLRRQRKGSEESRCTCAFSDCRFIRHGVRGDGKRRYGGPVADRAGNERRYRHHHVDG